MTERKLLMIPGPINFDPSVLRALSTPTPSMLSPSFTKAFGETLTDLRKLVFTEKAQPIVVAGSGTLAMDIAVLNLIDEGDCVLVADIGFFGERYAEILTGYGAKVDILKNKWGTIADPEEIRKRLGEKNYKLVTVTHVDTSTGCRNNVKEIASVVKDSETLLVVDGVCATAGEPEMMDKWGIDVLLTASQKAIGVPPGLALVWFNERALEVSTERRSPIRSYFASLDKWLPVMRSYERGEPGYFGTPPVNLILALRQSLKLILEERVENVFRRHRLIGEAFRSAMQALGLKIVPMDESYAANTMTAVHYPEGVEDRKFREVLAQNVIVAGGLGGLKGQTFRVGHMGRVNSNDILATIGQIGITFKSLGIDLDTGTALAEAQQVLERL